MSESNNKTNLKSDVGKVVLDDAVDKALRYLVEREQVGWWAYQGAAGANGPSIEATAWAAIALYCSDRDKSISERTTRFLLEKQNRDGGWSTAPGAGRSDWCTAPALLALRLLNPDPVSKSLRDSSHRAANFLFDLRTDPWRSVARLLLLFQGGPQALHYARGWPWARDCSFWVEPTSYSLLALKLPAISDQANILAACRHASIYLHSHACREGGWNHGCNYVLNEYLPPYTVTTAEALLALQDEPRSATIESGLDLIQKNLDDAHSSLALSLSALALQAYGRDYSEKIRSLASNQHADGSFGINVMVSAVSTIALCMAHSNKNPLKY